MNECRLQASVVTNLVLQHFVSIRLQEVTCCRLFGQGAALFYTLFATQLGSFVALPAPSAERQGQLSGASSHSCALQ